MTTVRDTTAPVRHADRLFIDGAWVEPSSDATIDVIDSGTEELYYRVAAAGPDDVSRAVSAARRAFSHFECLVTSSSRSLGDRRDMKRPPVETGGRSRAGQAL